MKTECLASRLTEPYKKKIGKVTFQVSSFCNSQGKSTAQQLIVQMLQTKIRQEKQNNSM